MTVTVFNKKSDPLTESLFLLNEYSCLFKFYSAPAFARSGQPGF